MEWFHSASTDFNSCESFIATVFQIRSNVIYKGSRIDKVVVDFDVVPHNLFPEKLKITSFVRRILVLIRSFLMDRKLRVRVNEELSIAVELISGVPQGTVLGPLCYTETMSRRE